MKTWASLGNAQPAISPVDDLVSKGKGGVDVGEMNKLLLQKVEELTLYLIEKDKQLNEQTAKNQNQEERLATMEAAIQKLTKDK